MTRARTAALLGLIVAGAILGYGYWRHTRPRWLKCALHAHTTLSDGVLSPDALKDVYAAQGYDVLAITDHDVDGAGGRYGDMLILPGNEVTQSDHHMVRLGTGADQVRILAHPNWSELPPHRFSEAAHGAMFGAVISHEALADIWELMTRYDAWEAFNGNTDTSTASTDKYQPKTNKPRLAVDDAHGLHHIGQGVTWVYARPREREILQAIRAGLVRVETRENVK